MSVVVHLLGHAREPADSLSHPRCRGALYAAVEEAAEVWGAAFLAYSLTDRCLHLVMDLPTGTVEELSGSLTANLSRVAAVSGGGVARRVRFRHAILDGDGPMIAAVCYTHRAAWRCGQVARPSVDAWSSLRAYQGCEPLLRPMRIAPVLDALNRCADPPDAYARFMDHAAFPDASSSDSSMEPLVARAQDTGPPRMARQDPGRVGSEPPLEPGSERRRRVRSA
jgi:hypothetical protein